MKGIADRLAVIHGRDFAERALGRLQALLVGLYGEQQGGENFTYIREALARYLDTRTEEELGRSTDFNPGDPYAHLDGKVFAICYPDNIYEFETPTLKTLEKTLARFFPSVNGIHLLPERPISHGDLWPQDLLDILPPNTTLDLIRHLQERGVLDCDRFVSDGYGTARAGLVSEDLPAWHAAHRREILSGETGSDKQAFVRNLLERLDAAYNSHFNDGGFSQKTRAVVDPRYGTTADIGRLCGGYAVMLDFVVNHLDIENPVLEAFRQGEGDGSAFIIITPAEYEKLKRERILEKTFRPRPYPLFTGMRKLPVGKGRRTPAQGTAGASVPGLGIRDTEDEMNRLFEAEGLRPLDPRVVSFLVFAFKVRNDQGLTAEDRRAFTAFQGYLEEHGIGEERLYRESSVQPLQHVLHGRAAEGTAGLLAAIGIEGEYARVFDRYEDEVFGERFFVYTTFSESQVDLNPTARAGFRMIIDDLFHLLASGELAMMRMDAIKYLWKEIGRSNFDMEEGNRLIEAIRLALRLAAPRVLPLDEVNSPDPVVYEMGREGGFAYIFGQVNAVPIAFNEETLSPIESFIDTMKSMCPPNLALFATLSTHDGRSVQGLGVQRTDGHASIEQLYSLMDVVETRGGKPQYRSVTAGEIPQDTFRKICSEAGLDERKVKRLFTPESRSKGTALRLKKPAGSDRGLLGELVKATGRDPEDLGAIPAVDYLLEWVANGRTVYELGSTSRSAFRATDRDGKPLSPREDAARFALAQLYVLTMGQIVPAIYFNDLLGLENDMEGYKRSGKPRDLNRHKTYFPEARLDHPEDPFTSVYLGTINRILEVRTCDLAFYPGSPDFEFKALSDTVFLNHPYARGSHSFILGNISGSRRAADLDLRSLAGMDEKRLEGIEKTGLRNMLEGEDHRVGGDLRLELSLPPYGALWLKERGYTRIS